MVPFPLWSGQSQFWLPSTFLILTFVFLVQWDCCTLYTTAFWYPLASCCRLARPQRGKKMTLKVRLIFVFFLSLWNYDTPVLLYLSGSLTPSRNIDFFLPELLKKYPLYFWNILGSQKNWVEDAEISHILLALLCTICPLSTSHPRGYIDTLLPPSVHSS